jgi:predicted DNA binding CopG/RHH family protein
MYFYIAICLYSRYNRNMNKTCFGKQDIGEKERKYMKKKIKYTNELLGDIKIIKDFLPSPEELAFNEDQVKVTIGLSKSSIDFFKKEAKKNHTQYQKMIRRLLDIYVSGQKERKTG